VHLSLYSRKVLGSKYCRQQR